MTPSPSPLCQLIVVGCSWGGLAAAGSLLNSLPAVDAAVVIVQHRGAGRSMLASLLEHRTGRTVEEAEDKAPLEPGRVYLAPPGYHLLVDRGHLALSTEAPVRYSRPSVDVLFESAAAAYGPGVVAVVLTGANSDGAVGVVRVAQRGGRVVVQDPATAERPEMPAAALATGIEATVLPVEEIGPFLAFLCGDKPAQAEGTA